MSISRTFLSDLENHFRQLPTLETHDSSPAETPPGVFYDTFITLRRAGTYLFIFLVVLE